MKNSSNSIWTKSKVEVTILRNPLVVIKHSNLYRLNLKNNLFSHLRDKSSSSKSKIYESLKYKTS
jgi:hypothetical protein